MEPTVPECLKNEIRAQVSTWTPQSHPGRQATRIYHNTPFTSTTARGSSEYMILFFLSLCETLCVQNKALFKEKSRCWCWDSSKNIISFFLFLSFFLSFFFFLLLVHISKKVAIILYCQWLIVSCFRLPLCILVPRLEPFIFFEYD